MELFFVHNPRETEIGNEEVGVVLRGPEQEVLWLEVAVDDTVIVEVGYSRESCSDQVGGIGFVIATFSTNPIKQLTAKSEVSHQVYCGLTGKISIDLQVDEISVTPTYDCSWSRSSQLA